MSGLNKAKILDSIAATSPDAFIGIDSEGFIKYSNEKFREITGWKEDELAKFHFNKLIILPTSFDLQALSISNCTNPIPTEFIQRGGNKLTLQARFCKLENIEEIKYIIIAYAEARVVMTNDQAHMDFVSTVSHELRTPLTSIKGFADTLIHSGDKLTDETKKKYINIIREQASRLSRLVEDLLSVSRLESKKFQLTIRAVPLPSIIKRVCDTLSNKSSKHNLKITFEENLPDVKADADRLEQIFTNLIDNAIKYSQAGSEVLIEAKSISTNGIKDKVQVQIIDYGIGISEADIKKIFTRFGRLDNPMTRQTEGTGLGLFITKSLVIALDGEIFVESLNGKTVFTVILPADTSHKGITIS